ncbi:uncharacterized protein A4U43_C02F810 [Asparagus officinalis]|uniref:DAGKc domain-containing protein n=1 Tax=Asparagus officinalis TaxID=4686 RepID=A0A5P1FJX2_ASPOF|nr:uncharacterized protein A4U43_C02F810 [Asparagus officinalis]
METAVVVSICELVAMEVSIGVMVAVVVRRRWLSILGRWWWILRRPRRPKHAGADIPLFSPFPLSYSVAARSSIVDSVRACGVIAGAKIDKEELRRRITIPEYLRRAMKEAVMEQTTSATASKAGVVEELGQESPEAPIVVFVNSKSGGRHGKALLERLQELMGEEQVLNFVVTLF